MREFFKMHRFSPQAKALIRKCTQIVTDFQGRGLRMTLRQLYYQLVSVNAIENKAKEYKKLSGLLSDARLMGMVDWDAIEDRIRKPRAAQEFESLDDLMDAALATYRLPRWEGQKHYVELWVEKDALAGILEPIAREYHITFMVNRGYSSQSAMYESAKRFLEGCYGQEIPYKTVAEMVSKNGEKSKETLDVLSKIRVQDRDGFPELKRQPVLLYLGDHDPSGEDMVSDVTKRLDMFGIEVDVRKIALTRAQVDQYDPPPNPAKMKDPRAAAYVDQHGTSSWEVDALSPDVLDALIRAEIESVCDLDEMEAIKRREERDKKLLSKALSGLRKKKR